MFTMKIISWLLNWATWVSRVIFHKKVNKMSWGLTIYNDKGAVENITSSSFVLDFIKITGDGSKQYTVPNGLTLYATAIGRHSIRTSVSGNTVYWKSNITSPSMDGIIIVGLK